MADTRSYHGQPVLKEPTWTWEIPLYFYTGGLAGASAALSYAAELQGNTVLARRGWLVATAGIGVSPLLLISDLGRPARFYNMLRVVKPTSPMNIGSWILTVAGAGTATAFAQEWLGLRLPGARLAKPLAAAFGLPLCTYTAALIANTAIPAWHEARRELPFVFAAGAALSAGAAVSAVTPAAAAAPARRLALGGAAAELVTQRVMEARVRTAGAPYSEGTPHRLALVSRALIAVGAGLMGRMGARSRSAAAGGGLLMGAGALVTRWSIYRAGFASAADPAAVIGPQRQAIDAGLSQGAARTTARVGSADGGGTPALTVRQEPA